VLIAADANAHNLWKSCAASTMGGFADDAEWFAVIVVSSSRLSRRRPWIIIAIARSGRLLIRVVQLLWVFSRCWNEPENLCRSRFFSICFAHENPSAAEYRLVQMSARE